MTDSQGPEWDALRPDDLVVAVMGVTGAGKSTFIECVTGKNVGVGHGLMSHTVSARVYAYQPTPERCVYLVDTPGFDDTSRSDHEVLKEVAFYLSQIYRNNVQLAGIIYLHRITDNRVSGTALKNLNTFKKLCGDEAFGHVILATSMWNDTLDEIGNKREQELMTTAKFWGHMHKSGSHVARWLGNEESAKTIIRRIIEIHDSTGNTVLKIQEELVNGNLSLDETAAGQEVHKEIAAAKAQLQEEIKTLREAQELMMRESNETMAKELALQQKEFEKQLASADEAQQSLKISMQTLLEQKTAEYERLLSGVLEEQRRLAEELEKKQAEFERAQRDRSDDEETFREAQEHFAAEVASLNKKIQEQERIQAEAERRRVVQEETQKALEEERRARAAEEQQRALNEEMQSVKELREELQRQQRAEEEEAVRRRQAMQAQMEQQRRRKQQQKSVVGFLGVMAGIGTAAAGFATLNPALVSIGAGMASRSASYGDV
ncbi:P-loop containing nucleoside triphosphate hydrolase protein [Thelonectria olida]|uniref:P-loop containing nucleoside triphosphate hydrolase protein n=1 Tax=Thelonectria olida TaxID=1576542 RepID=A0A9P8W4V9_9HYPO|nr:P-loop containing nucleoside triphosphate hydrolase protein [Thelonectria olida]